jgi:hypothetical protein
MKIGARHGNPAVLPVAGGARHAARDPVFGSVWLTGTVQVAFIRFAE